MQTMLKQTENSFTPLQVKFTGISSKDVGDYWMLVKPLIERGIGEGESIKEVHEQLKTGNNQLWIAYKGQRLLAACVTEIVTLGSRKVCNIRSVGGTALNEWTQYIEAIEAWAKENGCNAMRFPNIRKGWARVLKEYQITQITLERSL